MARQPRVVVVVVTVAAISKNEASSSTVVGSSIAVLYDERPRRITRPADAPRTGASCLLHRGPVLPLQKQAGVAAGACAPRGVQKIIA